jgi:hypothetical protein
VCWATSVEADPGTGEVVERAVAGDMFMLKQLGGVRHEPIRLSCGPEIASSLFAWMQQMISGVQQPKNGRLIAVDTTGSVVDQFNFGNALITGLTLPALDASSDQAGQFVIELSPERATLAPPQGSYQFVSRPVADWLVSNFRLTIAGLDCTNVAQIDALPISVQMVQQPVGTQPVPKVVSHLEIPDLNASLPPALDFAEWHENFVNYGATQLVKHGQLDYLAPTLQPLFSVTFDQLGIYKLTRSYDASAQERLRFRASMYCGRLQLSPGIVGQPSSTSQPAVTSAPPLSRVFLQDQAAAAPPAASRVSTFTRVPSEGLERDVPADKAEAELIQRGFAPPYVPVKPKLDD